MTDHPVLATARLRLRPLVEEDASALHPMLADAELMTYSADGPLDTVDAVRVYLAEEAEPGNQRTWAITRTGDDRAIGWVSGSEADGDERGGVTEIGFILAREAWGRGIASEAVSAVVDRLFQEGRKRVFADADTENTASILLLERLGFRRERLLRDEWETHLGMRDSLIYGLRARDWRAVGRA
ncbi:GNAT family protein [Sphingomonas sp. PB2P19]|uniref:GNAT family N-acetyltransferase n=1 Tax=Sphingomonas rhamnosi TaxID=3096156 RepID=UPI002FCCAA77